MAEPEPDPGFDASAVSHRSDVSKGTHVEASLVVEHIEEKEAVEEVKVAVNIDDGAEERKNGEVMLSVIGDGKALETSIVLDATKEAEEKNGETNGVEKTMEGGEGDGVGERVSYEAKDILDEMKEGKGNNDAKEMNVMEKREEGEGKNEVKELNTVENTVVDEEKNAVEVGNSEMDKNRFDETMVEEKKAVLEMEGIEEKNSVEVITHDGGENEDFKQKMDEEAWLGKEKTGNDEDKNVVENGEKNIVVVGNSEKDRNESDENMVVGMEGVEEKNSGEDMMHDGGANENFEKYEEAKLGEEKAEEIEEKNVVGNGNNRKDKNGVDETMAGEKKKGVMEMEGVEEKNSVKDMIHDEGVDEGFEEKGEEVKMDQEKMDTDNAEGKGEKKTLDAEMTEVEDVKEAEVGVDGVENEEEAKREENKDVKEDENDGDTGNEIDDDKKAKVVKKKRSRNGRRISEKGETKEKEEEESGAGQAKEKKEGSKKSKATKVNTESADRVEKPAASPTFSPSGRPMRERKTVQRLVEVMETDASKGLVIEKGHGTPLKNIPKVAYRIARKNPDDLKLLHHILFGRKGKALDFKNNILQFSGFAWDESDDKQRDKVKEKLDKCVKEQLLDLCDLLNISVSKSNTRKDDLILRLLDFLAAPNATTDVLLAETEKLSPTWKRKRAVKKQKKTDETSSSDGDNSADSEDEDGNGEEGNENGGPGEDENLGHSEGEKENEHAERDGHGDDHDRDDEYKEGMNEEKTPKQRRSLRKESLEVIANKDTSKQAVKDVAKDKRRPRSKTKSKELGKPSPGKKEEPRKKTV